MRHPTFIGIAVAAALVAAAPASAQRASLAERVAALEQQAANNQGNVDLLNQVQQLRTQVQQLQSQLEDLQQQNEQLKQNARNQYLDLDGRPLAPGRRRGHRTGRGRDDDRASRPRPRGAQRPTHRFPSSARPR
jgi:TolA-binding protein